MRMLLAAGPSNRVTGHYVALTGEMMHAVHESCNEKGDVSRYMLHVQASRRMASLYSQRIRWAQRAWAQTPRSLAWTLTGSAGRCEPALSGYIYSLLRVSPRMAHL